jgi:splicing factor 3B subunit 3
MMELNCSKTYATDYIVAGTDSGRIAVLEYVPRTNTLEKLHLETFGKSGARRIVPGQYLAADPKGRAIMMGGCFI